MHRRALIAFALLLPAAWLFAGEAARKGDAKAPAMGHMVFFQLKDKSPAACDKLVEACKKYLSGHPGTLYFSVGKRAEDCKRDVNDLDFDVALHLVFKDKAAHDVYATHPRHLKFIEENKDNWAKVRVFDSYLADAPKPAGRSG